MSTRLRGERTVTGLPADDLSGVRSYQGLPLAGSPTARLQDDTARLLASGLIPHCPHQDQPTIWFLPAGMLACVPCADKFMASAADDSATCHACGAPASAMAAWVINGVPCVAGLCEPCHSTGLVPVTPN